jgi:pyrroloquinoline quinone (PQQ) biosynthesis protein C
MTEKLEQLLSELGSHPALNNNFYREWITKRLTIEGLELFARNYGAWVKSFPDAIATLVKTTEDPYAKAEYVKTLYSEMGYGHAEKAHSILLENFFKELAARIGQESRLDSSRLVNKLKLLTTTEELINGEQALYGDQLLSVGAQLALEWQAYTMLRQLYDGARNYLDLWSNPDNFHEACEYFYMHIGAAEKDHKEESINAMKRYAVDQNSLSRITDGYNRHLVLIFNFWEGLYQEVAKVSRQIAAVQ